MKIVMKIMMIVMKKLIMRKKYTKKNLLKENIVQVQILIMTKIKGSYQVHQ